MNHIPLSASIMVSAAFAIVTLGACSSDESSPPSLVEYFAQLDSVWTSQGDGFQTALQPPSAFESEADEIAALAPAFKADSEAIAELANALDKVMPAVEARDAHERFVSAGVDLSESAAKEAQLIANAESREEVGELFDQTASQEAADRFYEACGDLQLLAEQKNIELGMDCSLGSD